MPTWSAGANQSSHSSDDRSELRLLNACLFVTNTDERLDMFKIGVKNLSELEQTETSKQMKWYVMSVHNVCLSSTNKQSRKNESGGYHDHKHISRRRTTCEQVKYCRNTHVFFLFAQMDLLSALLAHVHAFCLAYARGCLTTLLLRSITLVYVHQF